MTGIIIVLIVAFVVVLVFCIKQTNQHNKDYGEIRADIPIIEANHKLALKDIENNGIVCTKTYSQMGWKFVQYKTEFNMPDNVNIILDETNKKFVYYMLKPYSFEIVDFDKLKSCELFVNNGVVSTNSTSTGTGTSIGGIGIGIASTNTEARQAVNSIAVIVYTKNGDTYQISFNNNILCYTDEDFYRASISEAKAFCNKIECIIEENSKQ